MGRSAPARASYKVSGRAGAITQSPPSNLNGGDNARLNGASAVPVVTLKMAFSSACRECAVVLAAVQDATRRYAGPFGPP